MYPLGKVEELIANFSKEKLKPSLVDSISDLREGGVFFRSNSQFKE